MPDFYLRPEDVEPADSQTVLEFLNRATTPQEIDAMVEIPNERDVGIRISRRILQRRSELGQFTNLQQIADIPYIGPERFTEIIITICGPQLWRSLNSIPIQPIPIQQFLIPDQKPVLPEGFIQVEEKFLGGLPHTIQLNAQTSLIVVVPSGLAVTWRDIDPMTLVSSSEDELLPYSAPSQTTIGDVKRSPARIIVRQNRTNIASIPLSLGLQPIINNNSSVEGITIELIILGWEIRAGSLRGVGDFGSQINFAWRRADQAVERYSTPAVNPYLIKRIKPAFRLQSILTLQTPIPRFRFLRQRSIKR